MPPAKGYIYEPGIRTALKLSVTPLSAGGSQDGLTWSLEYGVLTVSGDVPDYSSAYLTPWASVRDAVNKIVFDSNVSRIGSNAFAGLKNLASRSVTLPASVTDIGSGAFAGTALDSAVFYDGWENIGEGAFSPGTTLYGGQAGCPVYLYAQREGLRYVPDQYPRPELIALDAAEGRVSVSSMNCPEVKLAFYSGSRLLAVITADDGGHADIPAGARCVKAFCWDGLAPFCEERVLRLTA